MARGEVQSDGKSRLMCAPGGGVDPGASLPDNLAREAGKDWARAASGVAR